MNSACQFYPVPPAIALMDRIGKNKGGTMFIRFNIEFWRTIWHMSPINLALFSLIVINSWAISYVEKLPFGDALYFAFITGLTIGYGDIVVKTPVGRILAVLIGIIGVLFSGLVIAVAVRALRECYRESEKRG
jgi:uncharacterized membrane protein